MCRVEVLPFLRKINVAAHLEAGMCPKALLPNQKVMRQPCGPAKRNPETKRGGEAKAASFHEITGGGPQLEGGRSDLNGVRR